MILFNNVPNNNMMHVKYPNFYTLTGNSGNQECTAKLSEQELGIAKLSGFCEWLSIHPVIAEIGDEEAIGANCSSQKMIIFAHHHKVLDGVQVNPSCFYSMGLCIF